MSDLNSKGKQHRVQMYNSRPIAALFPSVLVSAAPEAKIYFVASDLHRHCQTTGHFTALCGYSHNAAEYYQECLNRP